MMTDEQRADIMRHAEHLFQLIENQASEMRTAFERGDIEHACMVSLELDKMLNHVGRDLYMCSDKKKLLHLTIDDFESAAMTAWLEDNADYVKELQRKHKENEARREHMHENCRRQIEQMFPGARIVEIPMDDE